MPRPDPPVKRRRPVVCGHPLHQVRRSPQLGAGLDWHGHREPFIFDYSARRSGAGSGALARRGGLPDQVDWQPRPAPGAGGDIPYRMTDGVFALDNNARSSFAAHSFLVARPDGNLMIDSPRFNRPLADSIDALGGIAHVLLSHRDDVADADRWAERYGARVWIGETDADAAPYATDLTGVESVTVISPGAVSIPAPGHTQGHVLYHVDDRVLFTGDTLHWNHRRGEFDVFPKQTFFSWAALADTMDLIAALKVEWMFAGHGMWHKVSAEEWERQMPVLGQAMRDVGQAAWSRRPDTTYGWY